MTEIRLLLAGRRRRAVLTLEAALVAVCAWWGVEPGMPVFSSERS